MAVQTIIKNTVNLDEPIKKQILTDVLGGSDNQAHRFEVELTRGGSAVDLTGAEVYGYFIRPGDITVKLMGGVENGTAYVVLNEHCYVTPGRFSFAMKVQVGDVLHTVLLYEGCVAVTQGEGVVDDGYTIPSLTEWMNNIRKANLLDNSDFRNPVNQRGQTSYTTSGYNVDRWRTYSAATVTVTETGLVVDATSVQANLQQNMASLPNGTFTFAAKVNGNIVYRVISNSNGTITTVNNSKAAFTGGYLGAGKGSSTYYFQIVTYVGYVNTVEWAALYEGSYTAETLPAYEPKGYAVELAECRRYFRTWPTTSLYNTVFNGFITGSGKIIAVNIGPGGMRTTPTVSLSGGGIIVRHGTGYSSDATNEAPYTSPTVEAYNGNEQLNLIFKKTDDTAWASVTNNTLVSINLPRGTVLTASADL